MNRALIRRKELFSHQFPKGQFEGSQVEIVNKEDLSISQHWPPMD